MTLKTILNLAWKEFLQLYRDRLLTAFLIILPVVQLLLIAESTGTGVRRLDLAVWDQEQSPLSQALILALDNTEELRLAYRVQSDNELRALISSGKAMVAVIIPPDFTREALRPGATVFLPVILDATNTIVASLAQPTLEGVVLDFATRTLLPQVGFDPSLRSPGRIELKVEMAFNPTLNFRWSALPAQLAFIVYQIVLVVAAVTFVRERELGTLEQLMVTPIRRTELILGKALMALVIGLLNFYLLLLTVTWWFHVPMRGSLTLLTALALLFIVAEITWGTLISVISTSQQQAILFVFFLAILEITFSGYLVPTENMPAVMRFLSQFSPLQHFTTIVRAVLVKGATLPMLAHHVVALVLLAAGAVTIASTRFANMVE